VRASPLKAPAHQAVGPITLYAITAIPVTNTSQRAVPHVWPTHAPVGLPALCCAVLGRRTRTAAQTACAGWGGAARAVLDVLGGRCCVCCTGLCYAVLSAESGKSRCTYSGRLPRVGLCRPGCGACGGWGCAVQRCCLCHAACAGWGRLGCAGPSHLYCCRSGRLCCAACAGWVRLGSAGPSGLPCC
jgi:hypothetical protein